MFLSSDRCRLQVDFSSLVCNKDGDKHYNTCDKVLNDYVQQYNFDLSHVF